MFGDSGPRYVPALDGLRAVAVSLVLVAHLRVIPWVGGGGPVGVDLFFVISGFLITSLLLREWRAKGNIQLGQFYIRRALRIWPAFAVLLIVYILLATQSSDFGDHLKAAGAAAFSIMNWVQAFDLAPVGFLGHAWSLSIEEQFYLVWPAILIVLLARFGLRALVPFLLATFAIAFAWRLYLVASGASANRIFSGSDTHADPILLGCLLACITLSPDVRQGLERTWPIPVIGLVALLLALQWQPEWMAFAFTAHGVLAAWIIVAALAPGLSMTSLLATAPMVWLGKRSYSLYLWHVPILHTLWGLDIPFLVGSALAVPISILAAHLSYEFIELPFLRMKKAHEPLVEGAGEVAAREAHGEEAAR